jgi:Fuc2NAc and GlcNAc transferase
VNLWLVSALLTGVASYFACKKAMSLARGSGRIALPGERQSHDHATPTGGGAGLVASIVAASAAAQYFTPLPAFWWHNMLPGIVLLSVVGWIDDKRPVSSLFRLLVQLAVSLWLLGFGWSDFSVPGVWLFAVIVLALVWMMNLYNFMDGSNGMAGFQGVFAGLVLFFLFLDGEQAGMAWLALSVASACAGFLPLNFPVARVFMGDAASVPLGFIFGAFLLYGVLNDSFGLATALLIMSLFIIDATLTLFKRVFRGEQWYTAHAQHVYQRLIAHGWTHSRVLLLYQAINVIWVLPVLLLAEKNQAYAELTALGAFLVLAAGWYILNRRLGMIATEQVK